MKEKLEITAYKIMEDPPSIRTADRKREWMDDTQDRFAYRCLPLSIANQTGWEVLSPAGFAASWNGKDGLDAISIKFDEESSPLIGSHFGHGVLTFTLGYLFRTTKAHNLWVKGPTNQFKDGISALEGIIETDWTPFTFTMNWQFTRKKHKVHFEKDEPICTLLPYPRHYIGKFDPKLKVINENAKVYNQYVAWKDDREQFLRDLKDPDSEAVKEGWQKTYMKGEDQFGKVFAGHQTKVRTADFKK